ncbi:hypothetical protein BDV39DRAFT_200376 [Aspergillus sergii]|uniref:Uncharacterized protein n=1 Tax=Aspergillus sergii TaxID=1034303 RepID=A0A5N6XHH6_9EURO|nr:hypothetical protein BDV39DRAFT_200376 [Aspergillus sergii]
MPSTPNETNQILEKHTALNLPFRDEATQVDSKSSGLLPKPLEELDKPVKGFFGDGPDAAPVKFESLRNYMMEGQTRIQRDGQFSYLMQPPYARLLPWNSCKLAATLALVFSSPPEPESTLEALGFLSRSLAVCTSQKAAIDGKVGKVTVLGVNLVDVEMLERGEKMSRDMNYSSFAHSFVIAIAREGFRFYQSWGEHGYRLDEYLRRGGSRLRSWEDAKAFLKMFQKLYRFQENWTDDMNMAYKHCFEVDIKSICGRGKLQPPIVRPYRPWVRIFEINDVKMENIEKFTWEGWD